MIKSKIRPRLAVVTIVWMLSACGPSADQKAASGLHITLEAAHSGFIAWDLAHQRELIKGKSTKEEKQAAVDAYRAKRTAVIEAFIATYSAVDNAILHPSGETVGIALDVMSKLAKAVDLLEGADPNPKPASASPGRSSAATPAPPGVTEDGGTSP